MSDNPAHESAAVTEELFDKAELAGFVADDQLAGRHICKMLSAAVRLHAGRDVDRRDLDLSGYSATFLVRVGSRDLSRFADDQSHRL